MDDDFNHINNMLQQHYIYNATYDPVYDETKDNFVAVIVDDQNFRELETVNVQTHFGNVETKLLVDSGRVCMIIHKT